MKKFSSKLFFYVKNSLLKMFALRLAKVIKWGRQRGRQLFLATFPFNQRVFLFCMIRPGYRIY